MHKFKADHLAQIMKLYAWEKEDTEKNFSSTSLFDLKSDQRLNKRNFFEKIVGILPFHIP